MTYAGVLLAFSVPVSAQMLEANRDLPAGGRALVVPVVDADAVATHALTGEGALLVAATEKRSLPANSIGLSMGRALAHVAPTNGTYEPPQRTFVDVPSANGTSNVTLDVASLAGGASGWIVMGSGEAAPRFVPDDDVVGAVEGFASGASLGLTLALGFLGFLAPLVAVVVTHKPSGKRGSPRIVCRECGAAFPHNGEFCLRCGAYQAGVDTTDG